MTKAGKKNSAWKPKEDRSFKEVNSVRDLESSKITTDVSIAVSDTGALLSLAKAPPTQWEPIPD